MIEKNKFPTLYRYESSSFASEKLGLYLYEFRVCRETPKGWWIDNDGYGWTKPKWVAKQGSKRFAYPTKELALESFLKRKASMIRKLVNSLKCTKVIYDIADKFSKGQVPEDHCEPNPTFNPLYFSPFMWED